VCTFLSSCLQTCFCDIFSSPRYTARLCGSSNPLSNHLEEISPSWSYYFTSHTSTRKSKKIQDILVCLKSYVGNTGKLRVINDVNLNIVVFQSIFVLIILLTRLTWLRH